MTDEQLQEMKRQVERENAALEKIERMFTSGNDTEVTRATINKEDWELAKNALLYIGAYSV
jgi:hypothetical protein